MGHVLVYCYIFLFCQNEMKSADKREIENFINTFNYFHFKDQRDKEGEFIAKLLLFALENKTGNYDLLDHPNSDNFSIIIHKLLENHWTKTKRKECV